MYDYLLPIGTVVRVTGVKNKQVIIAVLQKSKITTTQYDYLAVPYPCGQIDSKINIGFPHDAIEEVIFKGFEDEERLAFLAALEIAAKKKELEKENDTKNSAVSSL